MKKGFTHESTYNESKEWYTPREIFEGMGVEFDLDPCSPGADLVPWIPAKKHLTIFEDGLAAKWEGFAFVNPPYGSDTPDWMRRLQAHNNGIALIFSRLDTTWAHKYLPSCSAICFIKGRVQFVATSEAKLYADRLTKPKGGCGAGSMLVGYGEKAKDVLLNCNLGLVMLPAIYCKELK